MQRLNPRFEALQNSVHCHSLIWKNDRRRKQMPMTVQVMAPMSTLWDYISKVVMCQFIHFTLYLLHQSPVRGSCDCPFQSFQRKELSRSMTNIAKVKSQIITPNLMPPSASWSTNPSSHWLFKSRIDLTISAVWVQLHREVKQQRKMVMKRWARKEFKRIPAKCNNYLG